MIEAVVIEAVPSENILAQSHGIVEGANAFAVVDSASYDRAAELMRMIKTGIDDVKQRLAPAKKQADAAHKAIVKLEKEAIGPREAARTIYSQKRLAWQEKEDRKRQEEEARLRAAELKRAEDERLAEAARLEAEGRNEQAEAVIAAPIVPRPIVLSTTVPKSDGVSVRTNWAFRIVDATLIPREWLIPDQGALGAHARSRREAAIGTVPGVEFYPVKSEATSAYK